MKQIAFRHQLFSSLLAIALTATLTLVGCDKEDHINPVDVGPTEVENYALLDYQDTLHLAYAMRTDLYECNNIVFQLHGGGRLILYSQSHLGPLTDADSAQLVSPDDSAALQEGIVALIVSDLFPNGIYISRGQVVLHRTGDLCAIQILGATQNGLGFRSQFTGRVHDLTAPSNQGNLCLNDHVLEFRLGIMEQEGAYRTYHLIGSNPDIECTIRSAIDIAGQTLSLSSNPAAISTGEAASLTASFPGGTQASANRGTLRCSRFDNVYSLILSGATEQGEIIGTFTGPIFTAD